MDHQTRRQSILGRLLLILVVCIVIFAAKIILIKKYSAQTFQNKTGGTVVAPAVESSGYASESVPFQSGGSEYRRDVKVKIGHSGRAEGVVDGIEIFAEIADTPAKRERGLSDRPPLGVNEGLLFVFEFPGKYGFWMKDMRFAIDMIWMNEENQVVFIKKNVTPESYPEVFTPTTDAKYVLEVLSGVSEAAGISVGDAVEFSQNF